MLLGDVGTRPGVSCDTPTKFDQAAQSTHTLNITYVGNVGE
jgi:hypothetical protein